MAVRVLALFVFANSLLYQRSNGDMESQHQTMTETRLNTVNEADRKKTNISFFTAGNTTRRPLVLQRTGANKQTVKDKEDTSFQEYYTPDWASLDSRPLPSWYDEAKFGIFIHWGVYSVPGVVSEWFWYRWKHTHQNEAVHYMTNNFPPAFKYADFGTQFKAQLFNPVDWEDFIAGSGAKYVVFTSKHHEGFANWNTSYSWNWNSVDIGPHRDIVGELAEVFKANDRVKFGLYFSLYEWFNPLYLNDKATNFTTNEFVQRTVQPQLKELINNYRPDYLWSDGDWEAPAEYWGSKEFLSWLYSYSPVSSSIVVNDRWGEGCSCKHGGVMVCADRYNPGGLQFRKWENAMTVDKKSWGFRRNGKIEDYMSIHELITELVSTVSCGGNLLMNIAPAPDGTVPLIYQERLQQMGDWLRINGEAIYGSQPWKVQNDTRNRNVWYTAKGGNVYAIMLEWPTTGRLMLAAPIPSQNTRVTMLGLDREFSWYIAFGPQHSGSRTPGSEESERFPPNKTELGPSLEGGLVGHSQQLPGEQVTGGNEELLAGSVNVMEDTNKIAEEIEKSGDNIDGGAIVQEEFGSGSFEQRGESQSNFAFGSGKAQDNLENYMTREGNSKTTNKDANQTTPLKLFKSRKSTVTNNSLRNNAKGQVSDRANSDDSDQVLDSHYENENTATNQPTGTYAMAIVVPAVPISGLPSRWAWVLKISNVG